MKLSPLDATTMFTKSLVNMGRRSAQRPPSLFMILVSSHNSGKRPHKGSSGALASARPWLADVPLLIHEIYEDTKFFVMLSKKTPP